VAVADKTEREFDPIAPGVAEREPATAAPAFPLASGVPAGVLGLTPRNMLGLQRAAGNRAVARAVAAARAGQRVRVARLVAGYADLFDFDAMADQIFEAVDGAGTDEQSIYHVLERLQRDPAALTRLEAAYLARHGAELIADLQGDLSGSELAYALALMNRGGGAGTAIGGAPAGDTDHDAAAQRIRAAVEGAGTDEEAVYAALMAYGRNSGLVARLKERYNALYSEDLRARLVDEFSGDELEHVLYLLGESALEESELTPAAAARLFTVMAGLTFTDATGAQVPVPYHYPVDGCYARAHMMAQVMTQAGIASERVFATSSVPFDPLVVQSQFSADQPSGAPPVTRWGYHVAPIVRVRTAGGLQETVIDPSTQAGPVSVGAWLAAMGVAAGTYNRFTHAALMAHLAAPPPPGGEKNVWTTDRNTMFPNEGPADDSRRADAQLAGLNPRMTGYGQLASVHEIAAEVRAELALPGSTAATVIAAIRRGAPTARAMLWAQFSQLRADAVARFPGDAAALDAAIGP
jgi:hypothetical protein